MTTTRSSAKERHDRVAPYWAAGLILLCLTGLLSTSLGSGPFLTGYALDATGPAWNYILFRRLFTEYVDNSWTRFFTPARTFVIFVVVSFSIEAAQFFELYEATFDPWDLVAYVSLLLPLYLTDSWLLKQ